MEAVSIVVEEKERRGRIRDRASAIWEYVRREDAGTTGDELAHLHSL